MHALTLLQSNRLTVLIFREYSEQLFDQLTTNRSVTRGAVKILFRHASPTCSWVTCCWTLTSCVPWPETTHCFVPQQQWFPYNANSVDCSGLSQNWFLILFMSLFFTAKHLHCSDVIFFQEASLMVQYCTQILSVHQTATAVSTQFIDSQSIETQSSQ